MSLKLRVLEGLYAVCQLEPISPIPNWAEGQGLVNISRSADELSLVCLENRVPAGTKAERGWRALKLEGPFDFALTGILASLLNPLAQAKIGIFALSTYNTDYVLVKRDNLEVALKALESAGHEVETAETAHRAEG